MVSWSPRPAFACTRVPRDRLGCAREAEAADASADGCRPTRIPAATLVPLAASDLGCSRQPSVNTCRQGRIYFLEAGFSFSIRPIPLGVFVS